MVAFSLRGFNIGDGPFSGGKRTVIDGPFTEAKELIAGFWLWQVRSMEEAIEWRDAYTIFSSLALASTVTPFLDTPMPGAK